MDVVQPEVMGFSSERLKRINTVMQRYIDEKKLAGVVTLLARRDRVVHCGTFGMADMEAGVPMQVDTLFRIYSMTKPITSTAVLMLYEEGRYRLTDPVWWYIPAFKAVKVLDTASGSGDHAVDPVRPITIRDLLTHTAGLSYGFTDDDIDKRYREHVLADYATLESFVVALSTLPLAHQPGTRFRYSRATDVLGFLVQVVSGMPFEAFLQQRIFAPLGMVDTDFWVPPEKIDRFAATYSLDAQSGLKVIDPPQTSTYTRPKSTPSGGGGLVSTISDYLRFARMLLNQGVLGGIRLLGRKTVELMTTNHLPNGVHPVDSSPPHAVNPAAGFGLGVGVLTDLGKSQTLGSVGTYWWSGAANTNFWIDPKEELIGILMQQQMGSDRDLISADFRILAYQALVD